MPSQLPPVPVLSGLADLAADFPAVVCDVWGVVHNGVERYPAACAALQRYRAAGGRVVLLTNAPRPHGEVRHQLAGLGVTRDVFDDVVTSGDVTRDLLARHAGEPVFHVGPDRDLPLYTGLGLELTGEAAAAVISCTGLVDDHNETPDTYAPALARWAERGLPMICANADIVVERGGELVWCAGALADRYRKLGGTVFVAGKPHPPIYDVARERLSQLCGRDISAGDILAIGDGVATDLQGANRQGIAALFVIGGIHAGDFEDHGRLDGAAVAGFLSGHGVTARACLSRLVW